MSHAGTMEADRGSPGSRSPLLKKLLLFDAQERAVRVGDDRRRELRLLMVLVRQKADSATALWAVEQYVEALRLVQEAIAETRRVVRMASAALADTGRSGNGDPNVTAEDDALDWVSMLGRLGAKTYELDEVRGGDPRSTRAGPGAEQPGDRQAPRVLSNGDRCHAVRATPDRTDRRHTRHLRGAALAAVGGRAAGAGWTGHPGRAAVRDGRRWKRRTNTAQSFRRHGSPTVTRVPSGCCPTRPRAGFGSPSRRVR